MSLRLPPKSFRDTYEWRGGSLDRAAAPRLSRSTSGLPFGRDGRVHPTRAPYEFYPTPPQATRALLSGEEFDGSIWEPACGEGHIANVLVTAGYDVVSTDLIPRGTARVTWIS